MSVTGVHVRVDGKLVRVGLQDLSAEIPKIGRRPIYQALVRARAKLRKRAPKPTYPIPWDNIRQKIKVIIMLKEQGNLPYRRTGDYQNAFQIVQTDEGYDLINPMEKASFIGGDEEGLGQSRIFRGRYPLIREVVNEEYEKLPGTVLQYIHMSAKQKGLSSD